MAPCTVCCTLQTTVEVPPHGAARHPEAQEYGVPVQLLPWPADYINHAPEPPSWLLCTRGAAAETGAGSACAATV